MNETNVTRTIMVDLGKKCPHTRVFRNNTGQAYQSNKIKKNRDGSVTLYDFRIIHAGLCLGSSDLIGLTSIVITPEMVGKTVAVFTAIEVKTEKGTARKEQDNFIDLVNKLGGKAGIARSSDQAVELIKNITNG